MEASETPPRSRPVLLVGAGRRPNELGAVLAALGAVRARMGGEALEPHRPMGLEDLEELLATRPTEGTLILDYEHVPGEDVGFVRRFLERHPGWRTVVLGPEASDRRALALLALPGTLWLPWPPDLEQVGALLRPTGAPEEAHDEPQQAPAPAPTARVATALASPDAVDPLDVGRLLEELVAAATLATGGPGPAFRFRREGALPVRRERGPLAEALGAFLALARGCAPEGEVIEAEAWPLSPDPSGAGPDGPADAVCLRIEFPRGPLQAAPEPLTSEAWGQLLEGASEGSPTALLSEARQAADRLRASGARVHLVTSPPDRLALELRIASEPLEPVLQPAGPPEGRAGKAEDPFA